MIDLDQGTNAVLLPSGINFCINVGMTVPALLWLDRWGRRPALLVGAGLMCLWLSVNAIFFAVYSRDPYPGEFTSTSESMAVSGKPAKAIIAATFLFVASYASTWGPVSWTYPPELFPLRLRGKAVALATSANWIFNFALAYFVPPAFVNITWRVYVVFAVFCAAMFLHVFFFFPETANKTLEEVEDIFDDRKLGGEFPSPSSHVLIIHSQPDRDSLTLHHSNQVYRHARLEDQEQPGGDGQPRGSRRPQQRRGAGTYGPGGQQDGDPAKCVDALKVSRFFDLSPRYLQIRDGKRLEDRGDGIR